MLRLDAGYGEYNYDAISSDLRYKNGSQYSSNNLTTSTRVHIASGGLMTGYQKIFNSGSYVSAYAGGNFDNYASGRIDSTNEVKGGKFGAKGLLEFMLIPSPFSRVSFSSSSSMSSAFRTYFSKNSINIYCCGLSFGPEAIFLGTKAFDQQRYGFGISNIKFWDTKLSLSGGYLDLRTRSRFEESNNLESDGFYSSIGLSKIF